MLGASRGPSGRRGQRPPPGSATRRTENAWLCLDHQRWATSAWVVGTGIVRRQTPAQAPYSRSVVSAPCTGAALGPVPAVCHGRARSHLGSCPTSNSTPTLFLCFKSVCYPKPVILCVPFPSSRFLLLSQ
jgi:hypothetical protein